MVWLCENPFAHIFSYWNPYLMARKGLCSEWTDCSREKGFLLVVGVRSNSRSTPQCTE